MAPTGVITRERSNCSFESNDGFLTWLAKLLQVLTDQQLDDIFDWKKSEEHAFPDDQIAAQKKQGLPSRNQDRERHFFPGRYP